MFKTLIKTGFSILPPADARRLALSVRAASRREAMPLAKPLVEKALRCAIVPPT
ncbi:hypothetical protein NSTC745_03410 [Nostoc sp. DSM 114161]|jgi:hypothetical protein